MQVAMRELNQVMPNLMAMENQSVLWLQPDLAGWLEKRGGHIQSWKRRFFLLQGAFLFYFASDFNVESSCPLGVVPVEGAKVSDVLDEKASGNHKHCFSLALASSVASLAKRSVYYLAAPSKQAMDEWIKKLNDACESRKALHKELRKVRLRAGELRAALAASPSAARILASAQGQDAATMLQEIANANQQVEAMKPEVVRLENAALAQDSARTRALVHWDLLSRNLSGATGSNATYVIGKLKSEADVVQELHQLLLDKVNYMQGLGVESLDAQSRASLRFLVEESLGVIQDSQARVRAKAPRYTPLLVADYGAEAEWKIDGLPEKKGGFRAAISKMKGLAYNYRGYTHGAQGIGSGNRGMEDIGRGLGSNFGAGPSTSAAAQNSYRADRNPYGQEHNAYGQNPNRYAKQPLHQQGYGPPQQQAHGPFQQQQGYGQRWQQGYDPTQQQQGFGTGYDPFQQQQVTSQQAFDSQPQQGYQQQGYDASQQLQGYVPNTQQQGYELQGYVPNTQQQGYELQGYGPPPEQQGYDSFQQRYGPPGDPSQQQRGFEQPQLQGYDPSQQQQGYGPPQQQGFGFLQQQQSYGAASQQQGYGSSSQQQGFDPSQHQQGYDPSQQHQGYAPPQQGHWPPQQEQQGSSPAQQQGYGYPQQGYQGY